MKLRKSEVLLLLLTALFLIAAAVQAWLPTRVPPATLVRVQVSASDDALRLTGEGQQAGDGVGIVNINTAGEDELCYLPGIGPALAGRIIAWREQNGPFEAPEQLMEVSGIGAKTYEALKSLITCEEDSQ